MEESWARDSTLWILISCPLQNLGLVVTLYSQFSTCERVFYWLLEKTQQDDVQSMLCSAKSRTGLFSPFLTVLYSHKSRVYARPEKEYFRELPIFPAPEKNLFSLLLSSRGMTFILKSTPWVCLFLPISSAVLCIFSPRQPRWHMNLPSNGWVSF